MTRRFVFGATCALAVLACDASQVGPTDNPVPILDATVPSLLLRGPLTTDVDLYGLGFLEDSEVRWNGAARPTRFVDETHLTVMLSDTDLTGSSGEMTVSNPSPGGGVSGAATLTIGNPLPSVTGMSPTFAPAVITTEVTLTIQGSDFVDPGAQVLWDATPLPTTVVSSTEVQATVPDYLLRQGRSAAVTVANPPPGGGQSTPLYFGVENPVPTLTSTTPPGVTAGEDTALQLIGTGFVPASVVWFDGDPLSTTYVADDLLRVTVPAARAIGGQTPSVNVVNPAPGGGTSASLTLVVYVSPPVIGDLYPSVAYAGSPGFTLIISGSNFDPAAQVTWDGTPRAATFVSAQRLEITVSASDLAAPGTVAIGVINPAVGGATYADLVILEGLPANAAILSARADAAALIVSDITGQELVSRSVNSRQADAAPYNTRAVYFRPPYIFEIDPYGGEERRVSATGGQEQWPRYSADGSWVYYMKLSGKWGIWRSSATGGADEPVLTSTTQAYGYPNPSHAGERVVYSKEVSSGSTYLWVLDRISGASTPLGVYGATSRWTPDDQWIIYWNWDELRAVHPDGTGDFAIAPGVRAAPGFDISPDGNYIVAAAYDYSKAFLISFPGGVVQDLPGLGTVQATAFYGP